MQLLVLSHPLALPRAARGVRGGWPALRTCMQPLRLTACCAGRTGTIRATCRAPAIVTIKTLSLSSLVCVRRCASSAVTP